MALLGVQTRVQQRMRLAFYGEYSSRVPVRHRVQDCGSHVR